MLLLLLELVALAAVVAGAALIHPGLGLVVAGLLVLVAAEVRGRA